MKMSVIGCGYLGAVHAACMAKLGHEVVGIDVDADRIDALSNSKPPFFEPGLPELLEQAMQTDGLTFSTEMAAAAGSEVHFICVGTPQQKDGFASDLTFVNAAFAALIPYVANGDVIVGKSTVPVGTAERLAKELEKAKPKASLVWNPEFLREGFAINDTLHPNRLVYGVPEGSAGVRAKAILDAVYATPLAQGTPLVVTDYATAQLVKVAANSFLATKISFINAMAEFCEATGADVTELADAIGYDDRIGRKFLNAGLGFGGGCLPKDIRAFMARAAELGVDQALTFLREVDAINGRRRAQVVTLAREMLDGSFEGQRVLVLGASFKPDSDDVRDSPALDVAVQLQVQGADVVVTDPQAIANARAKHPELSFEESVELAAAGADLVLLLTEWKEFTGLDARKFAKLVDSPRMLDGRNALDMQEWRDAGWTYRALGRH